MSERRVTVPARHARIEFLRARAAYERQALSFHTAQLGRELSPKRWLGRLLHSDRHAATDTRPGIAGLIGQGFSLASQYPYVAATLSSLFVGKRWRWIKWLGVGFAVWQAASENFPRDKQADDEPSDPF